MNNPDNTLIRIDLYYGNGICKTATGQSAHAFQCNLEEGLISHTTRKQFRDVEWHERKPLDASFIENIINSYTDGTLGGNSLTFEAVKKIASEIIIEQKVLSLSELLENCQSNGYELLFSIASIIDSHDKNPDSSKSLADPEAKKQAGNLIRQAAQLLLNSK